MPAAPLSALRLGQARFRSWRRGRPFWAGGLAVLAGIEILLIPISGFQFLLIQGIGGVGSLLSGAALVGAGLSLWIRPRRNRRTGALVIVLGVVAYLVANLGGFLLGTLLALTGGSLGLAWHVADSADSTVAHSPE